MPPNPYFRSLGICFAILLPAAVVTARADEGMVKKALQARYDAFTRAFQKKDIAVWDQMVTPDFQAVQPGGRTVGRSEVEQDIKSQMQALRSVRWPRKIEKLSVTSNEAVATVSGALKAVTIDPKGKKHSFEFDGLTVDTWTRSGQSWKLKRSELKQARMLIDGKAPSGPAPR